VSAAGGKGTGNGNGSGAAAPASPRPRLGATMLALIVIAAMVTPKNLPQTAEYGWAMFFVIGLVAILFLIPIALAAAELSSTWPEAGGLYAWVREAFGGRLGFLAVWCEWAENLPWLPTALAYGAGALAYVIDPSLANEKWFLVTVMLVVLWGTTGINLLTTAQSSRLTGIGTVAGALFPVAILVLLAGVWLLQGEPSAIPFSADELLPPMTIDNWVLVAGVLLGFAGMEMAGFHAPDTRNPSRDFPRATIAALIAVIVFTTLGSLAIAIVIPRGEIGLIDGALESSQIVFDRVGVGWLLEPMAILIFVGALAHISPWILGPAKGLAAVARRGDLPAAMGRDNKHGVPANAMIVQSLGATAFVVVFLFVPGVNTSYWVLTALTTQVFAVTYVLIFASVIRLRYTQPDRKRPFAVPGGKVGVWIIMGAAVAGYFAAFVLGFFPPQQLDSFTAAEKIRYYVFMGLGFVVLVAPPFLIPLWRRIRGSASPAPEPAA
jgi:amino acid transporter